MLIIPAIDLQDGYVVRFVQGKSDKKVYSKDPLKVAKHWIKQGAKFLHIVDLDGAFTGVPKNLEVVKEIAKQVKIPVEFGGGLRKIETIGAVLNAGVSRVVLGTKAVEDKEFLTKALRKFKNKIIVGVDAKDGKVMVRGWKSGHKNTDAVEFSLYLKKIGFTELIYTDTLKDGTLALSCSITPWRFSIRTSSSCSFWVRGRSWRCCSLGWFGVAAGAGGLPAPAAPISLCSSAAGSSAMSRKPAGRSATVMGLAPFFASSNQLPLCCSSCLFI